MNIGKLIFGILAALYCIGQLVRLVMMLTGGGSGAYQASSVAASFAFMLLSGVLAYVLLQGAFQRPKAP